LRKQNQLTKQSSGCWRASVPDLVVILKGKMKKLTPILFALALSGCISSGPWRDSSLTGPWFAPDKKATVHTRMQNGYMWPCAKQQTAIATKWGWKTPVSSIGRQIDDLLTDSQVLASWPASGSYIGKYQQRHPPYRLYLVAVDPIVLIGISDDNHPIRDSLVVFSNYLHEIPVATRLPVQTFTPLMVLYQQNKKFTLQEIPLSELPTVVVLSGRDSILLTQNGPWINTERKLLQTPQKKICLQSVSEGALRR